MCSRRARSSGSTRPHRVEPAPRTIAPIAKPRACRSLRRLGRQHHRQRLCRRGRRDGPIVVTTADNVLLTPARSARSRRGWRAGDDIGGRAARKEDVLAAHPEGQRRFYQFRDGEFSNCNLYGLSQRGLNARRDLPQGGQFAKNPMRIARAFGFINLIRCASADHRSTARCSGSARRFGVQRLGARARRRRPCDRRRQRAHLRHRRPASRQARASADRASKGSSAWPNSRFRRTAGSGRARRHHRRPPARGAPGGSRSTATIPTAARIRATTRSSSISTAAARWSSTRYQDQDRAGPDPHLPPLLPRGDLRLLLDEHGRQERPRLHHRDRGSEGRGPDHAAAAHGRDQGPRPRFHPFLRPICLDRALAEDQDADALGQGAAAVARGPRQARRPLRVHPVRLLLDLLPELLVEFATSSSAPPSCSRPIAGSPTAATR